MRDKLQAIVMAAGRSSRFKTNRSKLIEKICGQEMVLFVTKALEVLKIPTVVIVGYQKEEVQAAIIKQHGSQISFVEQIEQKGTAHALLCSKELWYTEHILIMNADMPLVGPDLLFNLWQAHLNQQATASFVTFTSHDPDFEAYGKVLSLDQQIKIIEAKDYQALIKQDPTKQTDQFSLNAGIYIFKRAFLEQSISQLQTSSVTGEFYITDLIAITSQLGQKIVTLNTPVDQIRGINTLCELAFVQNIKQTQIINHLMLNGVRFQLPHSNYIELDVKIGAGTFIGQGVQLTGHTVLNENCHIEPYVIIHNSIIGKNSTIRSFSVIKEQTIKSDSFIENIGEVIQQKHV